MFASLCYRLAKKLGWQTIVHGVEFMTPAERRKVALAGLAVTFSKFLEMASLTAVMPVVGMIVDPTLAQQARVLKLAHSLLGTPSFENFVFIMAGLAGVMIIVSNLVELATLALILRVAGSCETRFGSELMHRVCTVPDHWFHNWNTADLTRQLTTDVNAWALLFVRNSMNIFLHVLTLVFGIGVVLLMASKAAIIGMGLIALCTYVLIVTIRPASIAWAKRQKAGHKAAVLSATDLLAGHRDLRFSLSPDNMVHSFDRTLAGWVRAGAWQTWLSNTPSRAMMAVGQVGMLVLALAVWLTTAGAGKMAAEMAVILLVISRMVPGAGQLISVMNGLWNAAPSIESLGRLVRSLGKAEAGCPAPHALQSAPAAWNALTLDNVGFLYEAERGPVLDGLTISLETGGHFGLVGPSGSGKSTVVDLICALLQPVSGRILIDGTPLDTIDPASWRRKIGYVGQHPFFLDADVRANVAFGLPSDQIDDRRVWECLEMADLAETVRAMPAGIATKLGERGTLLSGGQRQRLAIARALYKQPALLILDEATSALDSTTEENVLQTITGLRARVTALSISHRPAAIKGCDRVYLLNGGRLIATGAPDEILAQAGMMQWTTSP